MRFCLLIYLKSKHNSVVSGNCFVTFVTRFYIYLRLFLFFFIDYAISELHCDCLIDKYFMPYFFWVMLRHLISYIQPSHHWLRIHICFVTFIVWEPLKKMDTLSRYWLCVAVTWFKLLFSPKGIQLIVDEMIAKSKDCKIELMISVKIFAMFEAVTYI